MYRIKAPHKITLHAVMCLTYMQKYTAHNTAISMNTDYIKAAYKTILQAGLLTYMFKHTPHNTAISMHTDQ